MARLGLADLVPAQPLEIEITPLRPEDVRGGRGGSPAVGLDPFAAPAPVDVKAPKAPAVEDDPTANDRDVESTQATMESVVLQFLGGINEKSSGFGDLLMKAGLMVASPRDGATAINLDEMPELVDIIGRVDKPRNREERVARRAGETVGIVLPATAGVNAMANMGLKAAEGAGAFPKALEAILEGVKASPKMTAFWDVLSATGAGAGGGIANEVFPGSGGAEAVGDLAGGLAPSATRMLPTSLAMRTGRWLWSRFVSPTARKQRATEEAASVVQSAMTPEAQAELSRTQGIRQEVGPDFKPGLAEATGSPQLLATQRSIEAQASGSELDMLVGRKLANVEAIRQYAEGVRPQDIGDTPMVVDVASGRISLIREDIEKAARGVEARRRDVAGRVEGVDRAAAGQKIRGRIAELRAAASAEMGKIAASLGLLSQKGDFAPFQQVAEGIRVSSSGFDKKSPNTPPILSRILNFGKEKGKEKGIENAKTAAQRLFDKTAKPVEEAKGARKPVDITFGQAKQLREELTDSILTESGSAAPDRKALRTLLSLRKGLDGWMEEQFSGVAGYKEFRQKYLVDFIQRFERGAVFKARKFRAQGDYMTADERVGESFLRAGDETSARQISDLASGDPELTEALAAVWFDKLRQAAVRDGVLEPKRMTEFLRQHESVLKFFPVVRAAMDNMESANANLLQRAGSLEARARFVESRALTRLLPTITREGRTPDEIMDAAMRNPKLMSQIRNRVRGTPAEGALKRAAWDRAIEAAGDEMMNVSALRDYIKNHGPSLRIALSVSGKPEGSGPHLRALDTVLSALEVALRTPIPIGRPEEMNLVAQIQRKFNFNPMQASSRVVNIESGRLSGKVAGFDAVARWFAAADARQATALLKEALFDESVAQTLAAMTKAPTMTPAQRRRIGAWLFEVGVPHQVEGEKQNGGSREE